MPARRSYHCVVKINSTHYFMGTGDEDFVKQNDSWIYNFGVGDGTSVSICLVALPFLQDNTWAKLPDMGVERNKASCGLATDPNGKEYIVVSGGYTYATGGWTEIPRSTEMFSLSDWAWQEGKREHLELGFLFGSPNYTYICCKVYFVTLSFCTFISM